MSKYLIEASRKRGFLEPSEKAKYYLVSKEKLSKMLLQSASWIIWSARWINLDQTPIEQLITIYGEIETL